MESYNLTVLQLSNKTEFNITFEIYYENDDIIIISKITDNHIIRRSNGYFTAFQKIRDEFLHLGFGIKCNGSKLNAVQSNMMSGSERIYLVKLGFPATLCDIVNIFDFADITEFPNTDTQNNFIQKWYESLRSETNG